MAEVKVQVRAETKTAEDALRRAQQLADSLGKKQATIRIKAEGLDGLARQIKVVENETAKLAMSADTFRALSSGAITAKQAMEDMGTRVNRVNTEMQSFIDHATGVERETSQITAKTSMFGKVSEDTFNAYTSGAITGEQATQTLSKGVKTLGSETQKTSGIFDSLTKRFTAANLASSLITAAISKVRQAIREAITDMKEMDKELTTIKMVSGATSEEIDSLRESAFTGAREMGRSVTDYLSAAERFTRAGYRDNIDQLSKLSLLTQNIGGVEEDTAAKFLLAADAAWKLNGSYDALMGVLDGVSAVADQNATDLGKIAEGITVAGSAFANAGESAATFTAMLGVTTASTQRSGSEMARGLRTILFRVRQVKAEFDDGEIINADDISNAAKALDSVGISVYDDNKQLKSMSQILGELAKKWDELDDVSKYGFGKKEYLQNFLAGNRNGNVLYALMDNWGKYEEMLQQYEESGGTALQKNAEYTDSWAAATKNLDTAWTNVVSSITDSGSFLQRFTQDFGDFLNWLATQDRNERESRAKYIEESRIDTYFNHYDQLADESKKEYARRAAEAANERGKKLTKTIKGQTDAIVKNTEATKKDADATKGVADASEDAAGKINEVSTAFSKQKEAVEAVKKAIGEERDDAVNSIADIYKAMNEAAKNGYFGSKAFTEGGGLFFSKEVLNDIKSGKNNPLKEAMDAYISGVSEGKYSSAAAKLWKELTHGGEDIIDENGKVIASMKDLGDSYEWTFNRTGKSMDDFLQSMESSTGLSKQFWASLIESLGMYSEELGEWTDNNGKAKTEAEFDSSDASSAIEEYNKIIDSIPSEVTTIVRTIYESGTSNIGAAYAAAKNQADGYKRTQQYKGKATGKHDNYSGIALVNDEFPANGSKPELIISKSSGRAYIANGGKPALVNLRSDDVVLTAKETKNALGIPGFKAGKNGFVSGAKDWEDIGGWDWSEKGNGSPNAGLGGGAHDKDEGGGLYLNESTGTGTGTTAETPNDESGNNSGGGKKKNADKEWDQLKKLVEYLLNKAEGELQKALKALDDQLKELEAQRKAQKEANELEEKNLAVQNALLDLEKAQTERTVRYYNETTGQWEWMADQSSVEKAKEAYEDAQKDLADYLDEKEYEQQKEAIEAQKEELQAQYDAYRESWEDIVDAIEAPSGDLQALLETLKKYGSDTMKEQSGGIGDLLNNLREGILNPGYFLGLTRINANTSKTNTDENTVFDSGGFASGTGLMRKGSVGTETVIGPDITSDILNPVKNARFTSFVDSLRYLVGGESPIYRNTGSVTNNNGGNYYINGVKVGSDMAQRPFAEVMRTIAIHANETA